MVPVMAGGLILGGKSYKPVEYLQVIMITFGVCVFNFGGKKKGGGGGDSSYGLLLIAFSLVMDAVTSGLQDKVRRRRAHAILLALVTGPSRLTVALHRPSSPKGAFR